MLLVDEEHHSGPGVHLPSPHPTSSYWHKEPSSFLLHHRTTSELPKTADVIVIGSGISGAFAARKLLEEPGLDVLMLEAREACWGATGRNGGHCQPNLYTTPADVAEFELRNFHAIDALVRKHDIPCEWKRMPGGGIHAYFSQEYFDIAKQEVADVVRRGSEMGDFIWVLEDKEALSYHRIPNAVGAVIQGYAAKLSPYKLVSWILEDMIRNSRLNLQTSTPVLGFDPPYDSTSQKFWSVHTSRGTVLARHILITTNAYTAQLLPQFESLIVPVQGEMSAMKVPANLLRLPLWHTYAFIGASKGNRVHDEYLVQRPAFGDDGDKGGELMFGGGRSMAVHEGIGVDNDDSIDSAAAKYLRRILPQVLNIEGWGNDSAQTKPTDNQTKNKGLEVVKEWTGIMGFSRDGYPWVGAVPDAPGLWLSAAFSGSGMPNAALSAQHAASLLIATIKGQDWRNIECDVVQKGDIPSSYIITRERMEQARRLPDIGEKT